MLAFLLITTTAPAFRIPQAKAIGTIRILSDGTISPLGAPIITLDKITYTLDAPNIVNSISVERSNIVIDGAGHAVTGDKSGNGFTLIGISNVTIKNTNIQNFTYGIYAETTTSIVIRDNNITANTYDGIGLFYCDTPTVLANRITGNGYDGIAIYNCSENNINQNNIATNAWFGIGIYEYSTGNVTRNKIVDNCNGIELSYSSNIRIFHNDFINQTRHASTQFSLAVWDNGYPSGGNYWSDYNGTDLNQDGIGDTPYIINANNQDQYPLMRIWTNIAISDLTASKTIIGQGTTITARAVVENQGLETENTNITVYANTTTIYREGISIPSKSLLNVTFTWNTTGFEKGNYTINAVADPVPGETEIDDNNRLLGVTIREGILGDVNADGRVDMKDVAYIAKRFGSDTSSPLWDPNADLNDDGRIDMKDVATVARNFGKTSP